jgi:hypothetical protein
MKFITKEQLVELAKPLKRADTAPILKIYLSTFMASAPEFCP